MNFLQESDTNVEVIQLNYDDYSISNNDHKHDNNTDDSSDNHEIPYYTQEYLVDQNNKTITKNSKQRISKFEKDNNNHHLKYNEEDNTSHNKDIKIADNAKNEICNRENQWYIICTVKKLDLFL